MAGCATTPGSHVAPGDTGWVKDEVSDSYVFGLPLVLMDVTREAATGNAPGQTEPDTLHHAQTLPPVGASSPREPNLDTLASTAWLDVSSEPVLVSLPNTRGRYMDARVLDMWTNVVWSTGAQITERSHGLKAQTIAFVPPGWRGTLPEHVERVDVSTRYVEFVARIETRGGDYAIVHRLQHAMRVAPLSAWDDRSGRGGGDPSDGGVSESGDPIATGAPAARVAALDAHGFFDRLSQALADNPPTAGDAHALKILANIGVRPEDDVRFPATSEKAVADGYADGRARVATPPPNLLAGNGWLWAGEGAGEYGTDYALRAWAAFEEPGLAKNPDEVLARVSQDSDGHHLSGENHYVIHFKARDLPPVRGFWSITAYTLDGALDADAPVRVAFGERTGARRNRDGSIDVHVAATRPRRTANWVPAPRGDFQLVLRLYAPKHEAVDGSWQPPVVERQ